MENLIQILTPSEHKYLDKLIFQKLTRNTLVNIDKDQPF